MKAQWKGHIILGQLGFPVRLYNATRSIKPILKMLHDKDGSPVQRTYVCSEDGLEIDYKDIVRAAETEDGKLIPLTSNELARTSADGEKAISIQQFFDKSLGPKMYFQKPYYIVPGKGGERAYALMRDVLARLNKMALAQFSIFNNQHLAALGTHHNVLVLHQLRFADEIVAGSSLPMPALPKPSPKEVDAFSDLVERYSGPLYIEDYRDEQTDRLNEIIDRKAKGLKAPRYQKPRIAATQDEDLLPLLQNELNDQES